MERGEAAVWEERDLGELDINVLEDGRAPLGGDTTDEKSRRGSTQGRTALGGFGSSKAV